MLSAIKYAVSADDAGCDSAHSLCVDLHKTSQNGWCVCIFVCRLVCWGMQVCRAHAHMHARRVDADRLYCLKLQYLVELRRNKICSAAERGVAGTHSIGSKRWDARLIIQAAPFREGEWPDCLVWKCSAFKPCKPSGLWDEWADKQISFTLALTRGLRL